MRRLATIRGISALVFGIAVAISAATPAVAGNGMTKVQGLQIPDSVASPTCTGDPGAVAAYLVSGTLEGCWYIDTIENEHLTPSGGYRASGTETFIGCLGGDCGSFFTTFTFTAKFVGDVEVHGRCHHPIVGGTGDFAGATGVINMHDEPNGCVRYKGHIRY
jgi:hypothetical protein